jgi:hypothetical protein
LALVILAGFPIPGLAQFKQGDAKGARLGDSQVQRWQAGTIVSAGGGPCVGIVAYVPVPTDWPEQEVRVVAEDVSPSAKISYQTVDSTVKLMTVRIGRLLAGDQAKALVSLEIKRFALLPPENTDIYELPDTAKLDRTIRTYLAPSPYIESRNAKIRTLAKEIGADKKKAWDKVEAIYDWVREKVQYKNGPLKGAAAALHDGFGDCEELTSLFIAICRAGDIPARTVWIPGHCYPEFYLVDDEGNGHWFPCQAAGSRAFGGIPEFRPILQKGDNFRPPYGRGNERQRYLAEHLAGSGGKPRVQFVRKLLSQ